MHLCMRMILSMSMYDYIEVVCKFQAHKLVMRMTRLIIVPLRLLMILFILIYGYIEVVCNCHTQHSYGYDSVFDYAFVSVCGSIHIQV